MADQGSEASQRQIGPGALLLVGIGGIIGSGWLFAAARAAGIAGPAAIFSWVIGFVIILCVALTIAELGPMFNKMGGVGRYAVYSHGGFVAFVGDWAMFVAYVSTIPSEASATVQYASGFDWAWAKTLYDPATRAMSTNGLIAASVLCVVYFLLNYISLTLLIRSIKMLTSFKIAVPLVTVTMLLVAGFQGGNFGHGAATFEPFGIDAILTAITVGGVIYTFNGFQAPLNFAREARNPGFSIPFAIIGSLVFCLFVFVLLQVAYIAAVPQDMLKAQGWHGLDFSSPLAQLAIAWQLGWVAQLLFIDAMVSPSGTGIIYFAASGRALYGIERDGHAPAVVGRLEAESLLPRNAMVAVLVMAVGSLWLFPSWSELAAVISVCYVIAYAIPPVVSASLRRVAPDLRRPVRIAALDWLAPLSFALVALMFYWSRWPLTGQVMIVVAVGLAIFLLFELRAGFATLRDDLRRGWWVVSYLACMAALSYAGAPAFGGRGWLPGGWDQALVAAVALLHYRWAIGVAEYTTALDRHSRGEDAD